MARQQTKVLAERDEIKTIFSKYAEMDKRNVQHVLKTVGVQSKRKHNARKRKRGKKATAL